MNTQPTFARRVFLVAGIYGLAVLLPQYFMEVTLNRNFPPPLTHPDQFYGFLGVATAWQFAFLLIARDVQRFRLFMLPAVVEKLSFGLATLVLYGQGRVPPLVVCAGSIDLLLAAFFVLAFRSTSGVGDPVHDVVITDHFLNFRVGKNKFKNTSGSVPGVRTLAKKASEPRGRQ